MTYPSKKDWWVALLVFPITVLMPLAGAVLVCLAFLRPGTPPALFPGLTLAAVGGLVLWCYYSTCCEITPSDLVARFGPLRWTIPLDRITRVAEKRGMSPEFAWGLAWSLDRVVIHYCKRNGRPALMGVAVSPRDKEGFLRDLADALERTRASGESAAAGHNKDKDAMNR